MKKNILILGGSGFLGFNVTKRLSKIKFYKLDVLTKKINHKKKFKNVNYIYADLTSIKKLKNIKNKRYNYIINLSGNIDHKNKSQTLKAHYNGLINILETIDIKALDLFIQIGSSLEYGKKKSPQKESFNCNPISFYGKTKYKASLILNKYLNKFIILRPYQIYGPHQKDNRLIPTAIKSCINNKVFPCTDGNQLRDFLYVDDFTNLILKLLKKKQHKSNIFNVGSGNPIKVKKVISLINEITKKGKPLFGKIKMRKDEIKKLFPNIERLKKELNWKPKINIKTGLKKTVSFYEKD